MLSSPEVLELGRAGVKRLSAQAVLERESPGISSSYLSHPILITVNALTWIGQSEEEVNECFILAV